MAIVEEGSGEAPVIDDGLYELTVVSAITGIREGPDKYNPEVVDAPIVHVNMAVGGTEDEEGKPIVLRSTMNLKFSRGGSYPPSTLFLYAQAFGVAPPQGTPFDTDWLVGKKAQGMVRTEEEGKWPKVINESLIPVKKNGGTPTTHANAAARKADASKSPSLINFMGEPDWPKFWAEADKLAGDRDKAKELVLPLVNGDLKNLEGMDATTVVDLFEAMKEKVAVPF